jgi:hypothetical protein
MHKLRKLLRLMFIVLQRRLLLYTVKRMLDLLFAGIPSRPASSNVDNKSGGNIPC